MEQAEITFTLKKLKLEPVQRSFRFDNRRVQSQANFHDTGNFLFSRDKPSFIQQKSRKVPQIMQNNNRNQNLAIVNSTSLGAQQNRETGRLTDTRQREGERNAGVG